MLKFMKKVLFLRKKIEGQNSMEELANSLKSAIPELTVVELPYSSTSFLGMVKNSLWARRHQGQINHIFSITEGYLSLFISGKRIITVHDLYFKHFSLINRMAIYILWIFLPSFFTSKFICISSTTKQHLLKYIPWAKRKTEIIYNPINNDFYKTYKKICNDIPIILHIGTAYHKNLINVIEAIKALNCKLIIVGKLFSDQKNLLENYKINYVNKVDISKEELINFYRISDIISFPSSQEGFGMIVAEANAIGKPVIAGDIPVLHEVANNAAYFVNPNETDEIRIAISNLLENQDLRESYIQKGFENSKRFNLKDISKDYEAIYKEFTTLKP